MINSIAEAVYFAQKINHRSIQVLADFYHMDEEREPLTELIRHGAYLKHVHLADTGRRQPGTGLYPYPEFARCLKEAKYNGRICIEAVWTDFKLHELKNSLHFLQSHFSRVFKQEVGMSPELFKKTYGNHAG
jgi:sugar phosphate isomerase/epimerase